MHHPNLTVGVRALIYNNTKYCMTSALRDNKIKECRNISIADVYERAAHIFWQVRETLWTSCICTKWRHKPNLQGVHASIVPFSVPNGVRLPNGTYSGAFGLLQTKSLDAWGAYATVTLDRHNDFSFTTPFAVHTYGFLMKTPELFTVNFDGLSAGLQRSVYLLIFSILMLLCGIIYINETRHRSQIDDQVNTLWKTVISLVPGDNNVRLHYQKGATRKVVILTCSLTLLAISVYYSSYLLPRLLIPPAPPLITVGDIASLIENHHMNIIVTEPNSATEAAIMNSKIGDLAKLAKAMEVHKPVLQSDKVKALKVIEQGNGILLASLTQIHEHLNDLNPELCEKYEIVELKQLPHNMRSMIFTKNLSKPVENMNFIIAERMDYAQNMLALFDLNEKCKNNIFPKAALLNEKKPVRFYDINGAFAIVLCLVSVAGCILMSELVCYKGTATTPKTDDVDVVLDVQTYFRGFVSHKVRDCILAELGDFVDELESAGIFIEY